MKVRNDFVTNSSSSSFIIAKNSECTMDEVRNSLKMHSDDVKKILEQFNRDCNDASINEFIDELCYGLFNEPSALKLGDWMVSAVEYSNEDDEYGAFVYDFGYKLNTENFKVR